MEDVLWGTTDERETQPPLSLGDEIRGRAGPLQGAVRSEMAHGWGRSGAELVLLHSEPTSN